jgi:hypothetical protein
MDYLKCKTDFQKIISSKYSAIDECLKIFDEKLEALEDVYDDIYNGKCIKINSKKNEEIYYNKIYDPQPIIANFKEQFGEENQIYKDFIRYCDPTIREKCCNCVSVSLYILKPTIYNYLSRFIFTIEQSIKNMAQYLPDWIYRLYLDPSVFEAINAVKIKANSEVDLDKKSNYNGLYNMYRITLINISKSPNCEIYLSKCSDYSQNTAGKRRSSRFSGFYEENVNINASREADGIVEAIDCYNLKIFENMPIATFAYHLISTPAQNYYVRMRYGSVDDILFSFSAGLITTKFKIKREIFENIQNIVIKNYTTMAQTNYNAIDEHFLIELFRPFCTKNKSYLNQLKYLFGVLPLSNRDNNYDHQNYYVTIPNTKFIELSNGLFNIAEEDFESKIATTLIKSIPAYKNDKHLLNIAKYSEKLTHEDFSIMFFISNLIRYYLLNTHPIIKYLQKIKKCYPNKFINIQIMESLSNITTNGLFLINDVNGEFNYDLLDLFEGVINTSKINVPLIGGNFYEKYLKYKTKYLKLKNIKN